MLKSDVLKLLGTVALSVLVVPEGYAQYPTLDVASVGQSISSGISNVGTQLSTVEESISTLNIQQTLGDKLGGLEKLKDLDKIKQKAEEKAKKVKERAEKIKKMKEDAEKKIADAKNKVEEVKNKATSVVDDAKNKVEEVKNKATSVVEDAKNKVNEVKETAEGYKDKAVDMYNQGKSTVEGYKDKAVDMYNQGKSTVEGYKDRADELAGRVKGGSPVDQSGEILEEDFVALERDVQVAPQNDELGLKRDDLRWAEGVQSSLETFEIDENTLDGTTPQDLWLENRDVQAVQQEQKSEPQVRKPFVAPKATDVSDSKEDSLPAIQPNVKKEVIQSSVVKEPVKSTPKAIKDVKADSSPAVEVQAVKATVKEKTPVMTEGENKAVKEKTTGPKAFKKVSYSTYFPMSFAEESQSFKTGTDDNGNYYFSDELAKWCDINFDDDFSESVAEGCIIKICQDYNRSNASEAAEQRARFSVIELDSLKYNMAFAMKMKQKYASDKVADDTEKTLGSSQDTEMDQLSGLGNLDGLYIEQARDANLMKAGELEMAVYEGIRAYCQNFRDEQQ